MNVSLALALGIIASSAFGTAATAQQRCGHPNPVHNLAGFNSNVMHFGYESRVEKQGDYALIFYWCITNKQTGVPGFFNWGTSSDDTKFLKTIVEPDHIEYNQLPDSSDWITSKGIIRFRPFNSSHWEKVDVDTDHPKQSTLPRDRNIVATFMPAQGSSDDRLKDYTTNAGTIDLAKLSGNKPLFFDFVKSRGKIQLTQNSIITVPANNDVWSAIRSGKYEKYDPNDFGHLRASIANTLSVQGSEIVSTIELTALPASGDDEKRLVKMSELNMTVLIAPALDTDFKTFPDELKYEQKFGPETRKLLSNNRSFEFLAPTNARLVVVDDKKDVLFSIRMPLLWPYLKKV